MTKVKYEEDYYLWTQTMVENLKNKDYLKVDWEKESPSLKANLAEMYVEILPDSKRSIGKLFDLPETIELTLTQVLDEDWFPD